MTDKETLTKLIDRHRHLPTSEQAERILDDMGWYRQFTTMDVHERDGISLSTVKGRPHTRWVTEWERTD